MHRRHCLRLACAGALTSWLARAAHGQSAYPDHPIKIIVQFPPGSTPDSLGRISAEQLQLRLGQPVVVENRLGAAGNIAAELVARSAPDGYTLLMGQSGLSWAPWLFPKLGFDPLSLAPVSILANVPFVVSVQKDLPVKSVRELAAYARANPSKLTCGTSGIGSPQHLLAELFMYKTGTKMLTVPYKGAALILPDLMDGRIDVLFSASDGVLPLIQSGKIRALAVVDQKRLVALPQVETLAESGLGVDAILWVGLFAPPGTPEAITRHLADELRTMKSNAALVQRVSVAGNELRVSTPDEMKAAMKSDYEKWGAVIKAANITLE